MSKICKELQNKQCLQLLEVKNIVNQERMSSMYCIAHIFLYIYLHKIQLDIQFPKHNLKRLLSNNNLNCMLNNVNYLLLCRLSMLKRIVRMHLFNYHHNTLYCIMLSKHGYNNMQYFCKLYSLLMLLRMYCNLSIKHIKVVREQIVLHIQQGKYLNKSYYLHYKILRIHIHNIQIKFHQSILYINYCNICIPMQ